MSGQHHTTAASPLRKNTGILSVRGWMFSRASLYILGNRKISCPYPLFFWNPGQTSPLPSRHSVYAPRIWRRVWTRTATFGVIATSHRTHETLEVLNMCLIVNGLMPRVTDSRSIGRSPYLGASLMKGRRENEKWKVVLYKIRDFHNTLFVMHVTTSSDIISNSCLK